MKLRLNKYKENGGFPDMKVIGEMDINLLMIFIFVLILVIGELITKYYKFQHAKIRKEIIDKQYGKIFDLTEGIGTDIQIIVSVHRKPKNDQADREIEKAGFAVGVGGRADYFREQGSMTIA